MRGNVAKRIRNRARQVYAKNPTIYKYDDFGTVRCEGFRRGYQNMKKEYKRG